MCQLYPFLKFTTMEAAETAKQILQANNRNGYTIPSARLYPFQWNWDAGFHALGWMYVDEQKAFEEVNSMFKGQWKNGMLPHIVFHEKNDAYFPGPAEWDISLSEYAPEIDTTGITQLPVFGFIVERMMHYLDEKSSEINVFLEQIYPKILASHRYLYTHRDPANEGLVYIQHNWESTDNSPAWDEALRNVDISSARDVSVLRKDNKTVHASQRPTNDNYNRYIHLIYLLKQYQYNDAIIAAIHPFLVQDVMFNALLIQSNKGLLAVGKKLNKDVTEIEGWITKATKAMNDKLWDEATGFYYSFDLRLNKKIFVKTSSGLMPLFANICSQTQAQRLVYHIEQSFIKNFDCMLCPSTAADEKAFDPLKYWRGPIWINVNWMLYFGLKKYGFDAMADAVKMDSIKLVETNGFFEYFDPRPEATMLKTAGLGADAFSWTASIYLDFKNNKMLG